MTGIARPQPRSLFILATSILLAVLAGAVAFLVPTIALAGMVLPLVLLAAGIYYLRPSWALTTFIWLLPIHSLLITVLLVQVGLPISLGKVVAAWKELLLVGAFVAVVLRALLRGSIPRMIWVDAIAALWLLLVITHFCLNLLFDPSVPLIARAYGARDWMLYLLPYFIGRLVTLEGRHISGAFKAIAIVGAITSVFGIIEYFFIPTEWWIRLGVPYYFGTFLNLQYPDYLGGLPPNFWAEIAGRSVRRSVSTYLSGQGFALPFLVIIPVVFYRYLQRRSWSNFLVLALCGAGLLLSITRMTIIACGIQVLVMLWLFPRRDWLVFALALALMLGVVGVSVNPSLREFVFDTLTLSDTSASARPAQWAAGFLTLLSSPLGNGLGFSGQVGARFGLSGAGSEAGYFKLTGDLGLPGLCLFFAWFGGILLSARRLIRQSVEVWRGLGLATFAIALGFMINNLTAPPDQVPFTIYIFAWLAGFTVHRAAQLPSAPAAGPSSIAAPIEAHVSA